MTSSLGSRYNLKDFVEQILERSFVEELNRTKDFGMFPLSKTADLSQAETTDEPTRVAELPYDRPQDAIKFLQHQRARDRVQSEIARIVDAENWSFEARERGQIATIVLAGPIIAAGRLNADLSEFDFEGRTLVDLMMVRTGPLSLDARAVEFLREFLETADPSVHRIADVIGALKEEFGSSFSREHTRRLMKRAGANEDWFKQGRRAATTKNNPRKI